MEIASDVGMNDEKMPVVHPYIFATTVGWLLAGQNGATPLEYSR
jgi:hypothetical protein